MKILTKVIEKKLRENSAKQDGTKDFKPVLKIFGGCYTGLFSELDEDGRLYGIVDLGHGFEFGYSSLEEILSVRIKPFNLPLERDRYFKAEKTLREYQAENPI